MSIEAMKQALEALELLEPTGEDINWKWLDATISALRQALEQPADEPLGYFQYAMHLDAWVQNRDENKGVALYTRPQPAAQELTCVCGAVWQGEEMVCAPHKKPAAWVGLTDEDKEELDEKYGDDYLAHLDAVEAKLKEKNGG